MANGRVTWLAQDDPSDAFPPIELALHEPDGLLAAGGDLSSERLLYAYAHGIFPWYDEAQPILWWSPDPRCVLQPGALYLSRRLRRFLRRSSAEVRFNTSFSEVIAACAAPRRSEQGTWITTDMIAAYERLHAEGWAHSIEVWQGDKLVGGLYGLAIGRVFFGESMFSAETNASKIALLVIENRMRAGDFGIVDCQVISSHLLSMGATVMPRNDFIRTIEPLCKPPERFENWPDAPITAPELLLK